MLGGSLSPDTRLTRQPFPILPCPDGQSGGHSFFLYEATWPGVGRAEFCIKHASLAPTLVLSSCVALGKWLCLSEPPSL